MHAGAKMGSMDGVRWIILLFGCLVAVFFGGCSTYFSYVFLSIKDFGEFHGFGLLAVAAGSIMGSLGVWMVNSTTEKSDKQSKVWRHHLLISRCFSVTFGILVVMPFTLVTVKSLWPHWSNVEVIFLYSVTLTVTWLVFWIATKGCR